MKQILHIFPERILAVLAGDCAVAGDYGGLMWLGPHQWRESVYNGNYSTQVCGELAMLNSH